MIRTFIFTLFSLIYMELIYHVAGFGVTGINPILMIPGAIFWAGVCTFSTGFLKSRFNKALFWIEQTIFFLFFATHLVYFSVFRQPLLISAVENAGVMAVTTYWREILSALLKVSPFLLLLAIPFVAAGVLMKTKVLSLTAVSLKERCANLAVIACSVLLFQTALWVGSDIYAPYYEEYESFYDPETCAESLGVMVLTQRDFVRIVLPEIASESDSETLEFEDEVYVALAPSADETENPKENDIDSTQESSASDKDTQDSGAQNNGASDEDASGDGASGEDTSGDGASEEDASKDVHSTEIITYYPNKLTLDEELLASLADSDSIASLNKYFLASEPTMQNEYTGMFEGYNLIYITAEGLAPYAIDENVTPTLYKLTHSGFVASNYYVPLWSTSTSDGEYMNLTGLIPDQQFSMKRSAANSQPFSLPAYFAKEGVKSYAYHNNTLSYYDRHLSHPNLGYDFKASKLGSLDEAEWSGQVFQMEGADEWPASDLNMMKATIPEYINEERFHVYYMTVSGHMNYTFKGNKMSGKNKAAVQDLPESDQGKAYIACHVELDKALEYLIQELEAAGKLEQTVICLSADHYPYGMDIKELEALADMPLEGTLDIYRNSLILWNSEMETVAVDKPCSSIDLVPTLLNLFGFDYDSRLYSGNDILSDTPGLVVFSDRSFLTEKVAYNKKAKTTTWLTDEALDEETKEQYVKAMKTKVKNMFKFSAGVLNCDYYRYVKECMEK